jgi:hypothetical protein
VIVRGGPHRRIVAGARHAIDHRALGLAHPGVQVVDQRRRIEIQGARVAANEAPHIRRLGQVRQVRALERTYLVHVQAQPSGHLADAQPRLLARRGQAGAERQRVGRNRRSLRGRRRVGANVLVTH